MDGVPRYGAEMVNTHELPTISEVELPEKAGRVAFRHGGEAVWVMGDNPGAWTLYGSDGVLLGQFVKHGSADGYCVVTDDGFGDPKPTWQGAASEVL